MRAVFIIIIIYQECGGDCVHVYEHYEGSITLISSVLCMHLIVSVLDSGLRHRVGLYKVGMPAILLVCKEMCNVLLSQRTQSQWCLSPQLQHSANQIVNLTIA